MNINYLDEASAQKISDGIMAIIPYNINIMDNDGIIIASGAKNRIGTVHKGAVKALKMRQIYVVHEDTQTERKGINLPIFYNQSIVGIIGISGKVEEVMQIGQIVVVTAQLMIENQIFNNMTSIKESRLKDFLYEWIARDQSQYGGEFLEQANFLGIDMSLPRTAVIIRSNKIRYSLFENIKRMLEKNEYIVRQRMEDALILFDSSRDLEDRLKKIVALDKEIKGCYVGESSTVASKTTKTAEQTYEMAELLHRDNRILHYSEVSLESMLSRVEDTKEIEHIIQLLQSKDMDGVLQETLYAYIEYSHDYSEICEKLHIHRNTLNYRLTKIEEQLGRNPKNTKDLMVLYIAIIKMRKLVIQ